MLGLSLTTRPVTICRDFRKAMRVFAGFSLKPAPSIASVRLPPGTHLVSSSSFAISAGNINSFVEKVKSSAYLVYVHLVSLANRISRASKILATKLDIMGEHGLPCDNAFLLQAVCANTVATFGERPNLLSFTKNPRT